MGEILKWLFLFLKPLLNERGMAGENDDTEDRDTQDDSNDEGDDDDSDETEDDTESDDDSEDEAKENLVPQKRVDYLVASERSKAEEAERKFDEFRRLGPEAYYKLYPDEKPDDFDTEEEEEEETGISGGDIDAGSLIVRGGKYDGMTLRDVSKEDPFEANILYQNYLDSEREQRQQANDKAAKMRQDSENEISNFKEARAKDAFDKSMNDLSGDEQRQINAFVDEVLDFMEKTGRGGGIMEDAYFLMKKDDLLKDVKSQSAKAVIAKISDSNFPTSISSSDTGSKVPGYGEYIGMTRDKIAEKLANMSTEEEEKFLKKAPPEFRKKFPDLPYPD